MSASMNTQYFLTQKFRHYYSQTRISPPPNPEMREWGFVRFGEGFVMRRHMGFPSFREVKLYLEGEAPAHVYYSTAYYKNPMASKMAEKEWLGADLIFDLDADHLKKVPPTYSAMLKMVKKELLKLIAILTKEFGFEDMKVVFSGGRGYHVHVYDECVRTLGSPERREIVDYIRGTGIVLEMAGEGWRKRLMSCINKVHRHLVSMDRKDALLWLKENLGMDGRRARYVIDKMENEDFKKILSKRYMKPLVEWCVERCSVEIDEPVSTDVKRLIRLPGSLHGKTGLKVTPLDMDEIRTFDPLREAIVFSDAPVRVKVLSKTSVELLGKKFKLDEGEEEVPEYVAVYLLARGIGEIV